MNIGTLISSVFMMDKKFDDKKFDDKKFLANLQKSFLIMSKLTQSEQIQFKDWINDVLIKKLKPIPEMQKEVEELIENLSKGGDVSMVWYWTIF